TSMINPQGQSIAQFGGVLGGQVNHIVDTIKSEIDGFLSWASVHIIDKINTHTLCHGIPFRLAP
ncbi:hypothetical protein HMPREF9343_01171, partial [Cutibacterium acnes HL099PA1]